MPNSRSLASTQATDLGNRQKVLIIQRQHLPNAREGQTLPLFDLFAPHSKDLTPQGRGEQKSNEQHVLLERGKARYNLLLTVKLDIVHATIPFPHATSRTTSPSSPSIRPWSIGSSALVPVSSDPSTSPWARFPSSARKNGPAFLVVGGREPVLVETLEECGNWMLTLKRCCSLLTNATRILPLREHTSGTPEQSGSSTTVAI